VRHASRSSCLLHLETSHAMVSQSGLKTDGATTTSGTCDIITDVALSES
jgi:hypothetical protein